MILIFDLDDTLYPEISYVQSGFGAVAQWGYERFDLDAESSRRDLDTILNQHGRGNVFDLWLQSKLNRVTRCMIREALQIYRQHRPDITLFLGVRELLEELRRANPLYLVTDGNKLVQARKVEALGIAKLFKGIYITHRFGRRHAKPSTHCFELIKSKEDCVWEAMYYVGDNPSKDFVGINPLGVHTVRVLTGEHAEKIANPGYEANRRVPSILDLPALLESNQSQR